MSHDALLDDVAVYALGSLPPADAERVRVHLRECKECREEYALLRPASDAIALSAEACPDQEHGAVTVSPLLKQRIMRVVRRDAAAAKPISQTTSMQTPAPRVAAMRAVRPIVWPAYAVAAACFAIALIASIFDLSLNQQMKQNREELVALQTQLTSSARQNERERTMLADLMSTDAQRYGVTHGEVVMRGDRIYIAMHSMPMPPHGMVYQAWTLHQGAKAMAPSVTFLPNKSGVAVVLLPQNAHGTEAVAVSVEPEGGSKQPTSAPKFVVKLG